MILTELVVDKESYTISSGTGSVVLTMLSEEVEYSFEGDLVFNGDETLSITINGTEYLIDLN